MKGLKICVDYFKLRGHEVVAIVPQFRKKRNQNTDQNLLMQMESDTTVVFTPSRVINGRNVVPYDDRCGLKNLIFYSSSTYTNIIVKNKQNTISFNCGLQ